MSQFLKILNQTSWQISGKVVTAVTTFVILGIIARNYGESGTGVFTLALTYLAIFYLLTDFGFNAHVLKKVQSSKFKVQIEEFRKLLGTRILWSAVLMIFAVWLLPFLPFASPQFYQAVLFGSLAIVASGIFITCNLIFQSRLKYDLSVIASSIGVILGLVVAFYLSSFKYPVPFLLLAHLLGWMVISAAALVLIKRLSYVIFPIYDKGYTINLFKQSWPIGATLLLNVVYFRADAFMVAYFKGVSDAGIYNVAYSVFQSALVLPTFIMNSYYPMMLKSFRGIKFVGLSLFLLATLGTLLTFFMAPFITSILTGGGFLGSSQSLQILSLGFPAYFLSALLMWILVTRGRYKTLLIIYISGLIINLALNFIYIPQDSFYAASWVSVISEYLILVLQLVSLLL